LSSLTLRHCMWLTSSTADGIGQTQNTILKNYSDSLFGETSRSRKRATTEIAAASSWRPRPGPKAASPWCHTTNPCCMTSHAPRVFQPKAQMRPTNKLSGRRSGDRQVGVLPRVRSNAVLGPRSPGGPKPPRSLYARQTRVRGRADSSHPARLRQGTTSRKRPPRRCVTLRHRPRRANRTRWPPWKRRCERKNRMLPATRPLLAARSSGIWNQDGTSINAQSGSEA